MSRETDEELLAIQAIDGVVMHLQPAARARVLRWAVQKHNDMLRDRVLAVPDVNDPTDGDSK